jgi:hypothetical protein
MIPSIIEIHTKVMMHAPLKQSAETKKILQIRRAGLKISIQSFSPSSEFNHRTCEKMITNCR